MGESSTKGFSVWDPTIFIMLIGEYQHNIDPKGRVIVPSKFREDLGERFYVTKGLDGCLFVLSPAEWDKLQEKIMSMPISKARGLQLSLIHISEPTRRS